MNVNGPGQPGRLSQAFDLQYPQTLAEYRTYEEAQAAVDFLADQKFPVENLMILGTNLRTVERVTGRRTWGSVLASGAGSGLSMGIFVSLMLWIFYRGFAPFWYILLIGLLMGAIIGAVFAAIGYAMTGGRRDFDSMRLTVATAYEIQCEHNFVEEARRLLATRPGAHAAAFE